MQKIEINAEGVQSVNLLLLALRSGTLNLMQVIIATLVVVNNSKR
jgi:hypothetical protein